MEGAVEIVQGGAVGWFVVAGGEGDCRGLGDWRESTEGGGLRQGRADRRRIGIIESIFKMGKCAFFVV